MDSIDVEQEDSNSAGVLYPGQRMDIILRPGPDKTPSSMTIDLDKEYVLACTMVQVALTDG